MILEHTKGYPIAKNIVNNLEKVLENSTCLISSDSILYPKIRFWVPVDPSLHSTTMRLSLSKGTETFFPVVNKEEIE